MKKLLSLILCAALLCGLAGCGSLQDILGAVIQYAESDTAQYNKILSDAGIEHSSPVFGENTASYVKADEQGNVLCADYVYKSDVVSSWAETTYIPVSGYTEDQVLEIQRTIKTELDYLDLLACCSLRFNHVGDYLKITCVFTEVDKEENYSSIYRANLSTEESAISMKVSEDLLLGDGYVKK